STRRPAWPGGRDRSRQFRRRCEAPATGAVGADEIGIAETADGRRAIRLAAGPEVAARETAEDCRTARVGALALEREKDLFQRVAHRVIVTHLRRGNNAESLRAERFPLGSAVLPRSLGVRRGRLARPADRFALWTDQPRFLQQRLAH